jgi:hypothetical protein
VLHLGDTDYDVRGAIQLHDVDTNEAFEIFQKQVNGIPVPDVPVAAIHVLLLATNYSPRLDEYVYSRVRLHYRDGGTAILPLLTQRDVPGSSDHDRPVPLTWVWGDQNRLTGDFYQHVISNPRLLNPHPERTIATLDFDAQPEEKQGVATGGHPTLFAITIEPVISAGNSGSSKQ